MKRSPTKASIVYLIASLTWIRESAFAQTIDCARGESSVSFEAIGRPSMLTIRGKSGKPLQGTLKVEGQKVSGSCSFPLETLTTGLSLRDSHMKRKYLETQKFPEASLTITTLTLPAPLAGEKVPFEGELSLHGQKQSVKGTASFTPKGNKEEVALHYELSLGDFGITQPKFAGITVGKSVTVDITLIAPIGP